jgi:glyoxylase I family protein
MPSLRPSISVQATNGGAPKPVPTLDPEVPPASPVSNQRCGEMGSEHFDQDKFGQSSDADPVIDEDTDPEFHHTVYLLDGGTLLGLHQHKRPAPKEPFSEYRVGLDHLVFRCVDRDELEKWASRLDELGIEHGTVKDAAYGSPLSFRDPDDIALEFFAPPG